MTFGEQTEQDCGTVPSADGDVWHFEMQRWVGIQKRRNKNVLLNSQTSLLFVKPKSSLFVALTLCSAVHSLGLSQSACDGYTLHLKDWGKKERKRGREEERENVGKRMKDRERERDKDGWHWKERNHLRPKQISGECALSGSSSLFKQRPVCQRKRQKAQRQKFTWNAHCDFFFRYTVHVQKHVPMETLFVFISYLPQGGRILPTLHNVFRVYR